MKLARLRLYRDFREHDLCWLHFGAGLTLGMLIAGLAAWWWP